MTSAFLSVAAPDFAGKSCPGVLLVLEIGPGFTAASVPDEVRCWGPGFMVPLFAPDSIPRADNCPVAGVAAPLLTFDSIPPAGALAIIEWPDGASAKLTSK